MRSKKYRPMHVSQQQPQSLAIPCLRSHVTEHYSVDLIYLFPVCFICCFVLLSRCVIEHHNLCQASVDKGRGGRGLSNYRQGRPGNHLLWVRVAGYSVINYKQGHPGTQSLWIGAAQPEYQPLLYFVIQRGDGGVHKNAVPSEVGKIRNI